jgi:urease accessory protein
MGGERREHWRARLDLVFEAQRHRTVLARKRQFGPLAVQRAFYPEGASCHIYLLHPPGGIVGGDRLDIDVQVAAGAHALLTQPGAAKVYRSAGSTAEQRQHLQVADGGVLEWLPQELILFPGARLRAETRVRLCGAARFIGWELLSLGRPVIGERFAPGRADLRLTLERDGRPLLLDRLRIDDGAGLDGPSGLRGLPVSGTLVAAGADMDDLAAVRAVIEQWPDLIVGATRLDDLLVVRALAHRTETVMHCFRAVWRALRPRLLDIEASPPRIWAT